MDISVLIPTYRRAEDLRCCLDALDRQARPPESVLVVVRPADSESLGVLREQPRRAYALRTVTVAEPGVVAALNAGLAAAESEVIAITDDDAAPRTHWLEGLERHFETNPGVGGVGGRDRVHEPVHRGNPPPPPGVPAARRRTVGKVRWYGRVVGNHHLGVGAPREVDLLKGANMSYRRAALEGIDLDERLWGAGAQPHWELGLAFAVRRRGWKLLYDPEVEVDHYRSQRFAGHRPGRQSPDALRNDVHNQTYLLLRWLPWWQKSLALAYGLLVGTRNAPGVLLAGERLVRAPDRRGTLGSFRVAVEGRLGAVATAIAARGDALGSRLRDA